MEKGICNDGWDARARVITKLNIMIGGGVVMFFFGACFSMLVCV